MCSVMSRLLLSAAMVRRLAASWTTPVNVTDWTKKDLNPNPTYLDVQPDCRGLKYWPDSTTEENFVGRYVTNLIDGNESTDWNAFSCGTREPYTYYFVFFDMGAPFYAERFGLASNTPGDHNPSAVSWYACPADHLTNDSSPVTPEGPEHTGGMHKIRGGFPGDCTLLGNFSRDRTTSLQENVLGSPSVSRYFAMSYPGWGPQGVYQGAPSEIAATWPGLTRHATC